MDRKRINGPEASVSPFFRQSEPGDVVDNKKNRRDKRNAQDIRPIFLKPGLVTQANGSAYIEMGNTKVVCAIYGPRGMKKNTFSKTCTVNCDFTFSTFSCTKRRGYIHDAQEREFSYSLVQALSPAIRLELFPKSTIDIFVQVLENDGTSSCLAAAIVASSVALVDAGIEMYDQVAACSAMISNGDILIDGTGEEEKKQDGYLVLSYMPSLNEITFVLEQSRSNSGAVTQAIEQCVDGCSKVHSVMSAALLESMTTN